jgi:hypothetical protein
MCACHHASGGDARNEFIEWSLSDPQYANDADIIGRRWDSLHKDKSGGITYRTLNHILAEHGAEQLPPVVPEDEFMDEAGDVETSRTGKYATKTMGQLLAMPNPKWLILGLLIERGLFEIYGRFKTGKTFWAVEFACCVATGHDFFGSPVKQGRVLYIIAEGSRKLFAYRLQQWAKERGVDPGLLESNIDVLSVAVPIDDAKEVTAFIADNPAARSLVIIDTLFRSMKGDVMNPGDFQTFVNGCAYIQRKLDCGVLFLHHQKRNDAKGAFGSVVGEASVDAALRVTAPRKGISVLHVDILRDGDANQKPWECNIEERKIDDPSLVDGDVSTIGVLVFNSRGSSDVLREMVRAIKDHEPESMDDLMRVTGLKERTAERRLSQCRAKGWVVKGSLKLTAEGLGEASDLADFDEYEDE